MAARTATSTKSRSQKERRPNKQRGERSSSAQDQGTRLRIVQVDVLKVALDPENARLHNRRNIDSIKASLLEFDQQKNIVVSKDGVVIAGNGTVIAARELYEEGREEWQYLDANISKLTGDEAKAYGLTDNRSAELAEWSFDQLSKSLLEIKDDFDLPALGWLDFETKPLFDADYTPPAVVNSSNPFDAGSDAANVRPIVVTPDQRVVIDQAIARVRETEGDETISEGRCIELISADFLAGLTREREEE